MDVDKVKDSLKKTFFKDKGVRLTVIIGLCGIVLIYLSGLFEGDKNDKTQTPEKTAVNSAVNYEQKLEESLARIVMAITGEESPEVLVTLESGGETVYAEDETTASQSENDFTTAERETVHVILKSSDGGQHALTVMEIQPKVKGVVIVSSCAGNPVIREKLTEAVKTALDISSARVCITDTG